MFGNERFSFRHQRNVRKVYETPHEKRQRRLGKKIEKERRKKAALGWNAEHMVLERSFFLVFISLFIIDLGNDKYK